MMTPEEARKAWVEALRSGEYKQGKEYLARNGRYCCLGVACELAIKDGVPVRAVTLGEDSYDHGAIKYDDETGAAPDAVREWLGLRSAVGEYTARNNRMTDLARRNDAGANFAKIAAVIESAPKGLFEDAA